MNTPLPTRDVLKPAYDVLRAKFPNENIRIQLQYQCDMMGHLGWQTEAPKYGHTIWVGAEYYRGETLNEAVESAMNYKPKDPARIEAAKKLREQAEAIEKGDAPLPEQS